MSLPRVSSSLNKVLVGQHNGPVQLVWETPMTAADHDEANDHLAERAKHAAQRHVGIGVSKTEADVAAGASKLAGVVVYGDACGYLLG